MLGVPEAVVPYCLAGGKFEAVFFGHNFQLIVSNRIVLRDVIVYRHVVGFLFFGSRGSVSVRKD